MPIGAFKLTAIARAAAAAGGPSYRTDAYASYLKLAVPFDSVNGTTDIAYLISGTGLGGSATKTQGSSATTSSTRVLWANYGTAEVNSRAGSALTYALPTSMPNSASGSYVVEGWFYATSSSTNSNWVLSSADSGGRWLLGLHTGTTNQFAGENWVGLYGQGWHHCAIVCAAGTKRFYVDGIYKGAFSTSNTGFTTLHVGQFNAGDSNDFLGYIQDLRVYIGTNKGYTGTSTNIQNFALPNSIISIDNTRTAAVISNQQGSPTLSATGGKFDGYINHNADQQSLCTISAADSTWTLNSDRPWTIEFWIYLTQSAGIAANMPILRITDSTAGLSLVTNTTTNRSYRLYLDSTLQTAFTIANTTWTHIALVSNGANNIKLFNNGTQVNSLTYTRSDNKTEFVFGYDGNYAAISHYRFDDLRVSDIARYTAAFTAPTTAFVNDGNTLALLHFNNNRTDDNI